MFSSWLWHVWTKDVKGSLDPQWARKQLSLLMTWTCQHLKFMEHSHPLNFWDNSLTTRIGKWLIMLNDFIGPIGYLVHAHGICYPVSAISQWVNEPIYCLWYLEIMYKSKWAFSWMKELFLFFLDIQHPLKFLHLARHPCSIFTLDTFFKGSEMFDDFVTGMTWRTHPR